MSTRYRIEIELTLGKDAETSVVEQGREVCASYGDFVAVDQGGRRQIPHDEFIDGPEQALLELLDRNQLFGQIGIEIVKMACSRVNGEPEEVSRAE